MRRHFKARRKSLALVDLLCYCSRWVLLLRIKGSGCPRPLYTISSCKIDRVKSLSCHGGVFLPLERIGWTEHDQTAGELMQTGPSSSFDREVTLFASHYIQDTRKNLAKPRSFAGHSTHQKEYQSTRRKTFVSPITPMGDSLPHSKNSSCGCSLIRNEQRKAIFIV